MTLELLFVAVVAVSYLVGKLAGRILVGATADFLARLRPCVLRLG